MDFPRVLSSFSRFVLCPSPPHGRFQGISRPLTKRTTTWSRPRHISTQSSRQHHRHLQYAKMARAGRNAPCRRSNRGVLPVQGNRARAGFDKYSPAMVLRNPLRLAGAVKMPAWQAAAPNWLCYLEQCGCRCCRRLLSSPLRGAERT
jgi:hypothetical protein